MLNVSRMAQYEKDNLISIFSILELCMSFGQTDIYMFCKIQERKNSQKPNQV
jgi:hypothetical protein